jgi:Bacterial membrane protein YfhO
MEQELVAGSRWFRKDLVVGLLVLLAEILIFYRKVIFSSHFVIPWDFRYYHLPLASFIASSFRNGQFPLWDPYTYCGVPFFANIQAQVFYPPTWITVLVANLFDRDKLYYFLELHLLSHILLAGFFTFLLLRELDIRRDAALIGATIFQLGPYFTSQTQHLGAIDGAAWIPLACLSAVRLSKVRSLRWTGVLALSLSLSILTGFPSAAAASFVCTFTLALCLIAFRMSPPRLILAWVVAALLAIAISAVELVPALQASSLSVSKFRADFRGQTFGLPWQAFVSMLSPNHYGIFDISSYKAPWNPTFLYLYCGIPAICSTGILACVALKSKLPRYAPPFAILTVLSLFLMLGTRTPPGRIIFPVLFNLFGDWMYVEFLMIGFSLGIAVLAALGANVLLQKPAYSIALLLITFIDLTLVGSGRPMNTASVDAEPHINHTTFAGSKDLLDRMRGFVNKSTPPFRFDTYNDAGGWVTTATMTELPTANGNDPFALYRLMQVRLLFTEGERWGRYYQVSQLDSPILDLLNVRYLLSQTPLPPNSKFVHVADLPGRKLYENRTALPRFFLVPHVQPVDSLSKAIERMRSPDFDPRNVAVVEGGAVMHSTADAHEVVQVIEYRPNEFVLQVDTSEPRYLVTSEVNYPGWQAWVDAREQPIFMTNGAFRGLPLSAGKHLVAFQFRPPILLWSALASGLASVILAALLHRQPWVQSSHV